VTFTERGHQRGDRDSHDCIAPEGLTNTLSVPRLELPRGNAAGFFIFKET
jgi:hypothetical protein